MNSPPPSFRSLSDESSSGSSRGIELSSISTRSDFTNLIGEAGPGPVNTTLESTAIARLEIKPRMKAYQLSDSTKDQMLRHALEMLEHYEAENQLLREQQVSGFLIRIALVY